MEREQPSPGEGNFSATFLLETVTAVDLGQVTMHQEGYVVVALVLTVIMLFGLVGNGIIIFAFLRFKDLRIQCYILIVNLAVSDFLFSTVCLPVTIVTSITQKWQLSSGGCQFYGFASGWFALTSINTQAAIALERYLVMIKSQNTQSVKRKTSESFLVVSCPWVYAFCWSVAPLFGWNAYKVDETGMYCSFDVVDSSPNFRSYIVSIGIGAFVVPLTIIIFCYSSIFFAINKYKRDFHQNSENMNFSVHMGSAMLPHPKRDYKTAQIGVTCVVLFCIAWMPYAIVSWVSVAGYYEQIGPYSTLITSLFAKSSVIYNPGVYAACLPRFRRRLQYLCTTCHKLKIIPQRKYSPSSRDVSSAKHNNSSWVVDFPLEASYRSCHSHGVRLSAANGKGSKRETVITPSDEVYKSLTTPNASQV